MSIANAAMRTEKRQKARRQEVRISHFFLSNGFLIVNIGP